MKAIFKIFSVILSLFLTAAAIWLIYEMFTLNVLPFKILLILTAIIILLGLVFILLQNKFTHSLPAKIIISILTATITFVYVVAGFYVGKTSSLINSITVPTTQASSVVEVYALKDSSFNSEQSLNGQKVGVAPSLSAEMADGCLQAIADDGIDVTEVKYETLEDTASALYNGEVAAIILNSTIAEAIVDLDDSTFSNFYNDTQIIYTYTVTTQTTLTTRSVDNITETPFNVLITGMDSRNGFAEISRSDVNMVATVNPKTRIVLLTSIPRDYYVETVCGPDSNCPSGAIDKLTHTGLYGTETTKATIEKLLGIEINYTMQVNFSSVINLVDALNGIDVTVAPGYAVEQFWTNENYGVSEGVNHLNGEAALAYARERYAYAEGDRQRIKNQQEVLMAIANKASSPAIITNYPALIDALSGAFNTDLSSQEIQDFIKFQISQSPEWTFINYSLDGTGSTELSAALGTNAYVMIPDQETVNVGKQRIEAVLNGKNAQEIENIN